MNWKILKSIDQLDAVDEMSKIAPVVIFKHSTSCSISATALNRIERKWKPENHPNVEAYYLDLIANRSISNTIAGRYGVDHQSPQILVILNGECVYDNSHFGISYDEVMEVITAKSL